MSYTISRTIDEMRKRRYTTTTCEAPTMEEVLAMDRVMRLHDAEVEAGKAMDACTSREAEQE